MDLKLFSRKRGDIPYTHDRPLDESCYREVHNCDMFVTILGGRYGSEKSSSKSGTNKDFFDRYDSVTKQEYKTAVDKDMPIYVFVEKSVYADYETYLKNKDNKTIVYPHVNSINSLILIEEILNQPRNNPVHTFEKYNEIEEWLRAQWAGLFQELLRRRTEQQRLSSLESEVKELSVINQTLKNYLERIVEKVDPGQSKKFIQEEAQKLEMATKVAKFSECRYVRHLTERHEMKVDQLVKVFESAKTLKQLFEGIKDLPKKNPGCDALRLQTMRTRALTDVNRARQILGAPTFPEPESNRDDSAAN